MTISKYAAIAAMLLAASSARAQESGVFLKLPISPRAAAMGDAGVALAADPLGIYYNPAGISDLKRPQAAFAHHIYLEDISGDTAGLAMPFGATTLAIAPTVFKMKEEPVYDSFGYDTGRSFGYQSMILPAAVSHRFGRLSLGLAAKLYSEEIDGEASQTTAFDAGAAFSLGRLKFGLAGQNFGGKIFDCDVAKVMRAGAAYAGDNFTLAADAVKEGEAGTFLNAGGEYTLLDAAKLRAGWRMRDEFGGPTFGLGLGYRDLTLDYAYVGYGDLGDTHKIGLSYSFGRERSAARREERAVPNREPSLAWSGEAGYRSAGVAPAAGNTSSTFIYRVKYSDPDGNLPAGGHPKLHVLKNGAEVPGSPFAMQYISGENRGGAVYSYGLALEAGKDYSYAFEAMDTAGAAAGGQPTAYDKGPVVEQARAPGGINVAVAEFTGKNVSQADASIVADFLRTALVATGRFNVMDRNNMDTVLSEQKFQNSGCTEQECAVEMGKLLSVKQMMVGSLSKLLDTYYITVNVVDVETGKIIASFDGDAGNSRELKEACRRITDKVAGK